MSNDRKREKRLASSSDLSAGDLGPTGKTNTNKNHKATRKANQLCRQVAETLDLVLAGDCHCDLLQSLHVISVVPAPNASRLLVTVAANLPKEDFDRQQIQQRLEEQSGRLRSEIAAAINRKRVPALCFNVIGPLSSFL